MEVYLKGGSKIFLVDFPEQYLKAICPICHHFANLVCTYDGYPINSDCYHSFQYGTKNFCEHQDCYQGSPRHISQKVLVQIFLEQQQFVGFIQWDANIKKCPYHQFFPIKNVASRIQKLGKLYL